jgi:signal recognition particle subunit SEC65
MWRWRPEQDLLLRTLVRPATMLELTDAEWDALLPRARAARLLGRLAAEATARDMSDRLPLKARHHFRAAAAVATHHLRMVRWELNRIERALASLPVPILLLKGAAYVAAELPPARGRLVTDVDVMVPRPSLDTVQAALQEAGWQPIERDSYVQHYYRTWMHELPPLHHRDRGTVVDVHHTILPLTARLKPDPGELWAAARRLGTGRQHVLGPADMVLHSAAHLFCDGDLHRSLRDLIDIHDLLTLFGNDAGFWHELVPRAGALNLGRPLYYALRYSQRLRCTPVPKATMDAAVAHAPPRPVVSIMDRLVLRTLLPEPTIGAEASRSAALVLYVRAHWLRMPPWLLAPHLARQFIARVSHHH